MRRGQSTVELALMVPTTLGVLFVIMEFAFYFGDTHYINYAAFAGARAQQVGQSADDATGLLLDGNVTKDATVSASASKGSVSIHQPWVADLPFADLAGDISFDVTVVAGPDEEKYEGRSMPSGLVKMYADDNCRGGC